ncbi:hypothetical protein F5890DRAFT_1537703 [Lentinula detonsa]|uniref:Uncharacterized protein n=1 Tax=Lentinula detonsa TaxID=2804962 RepID=A0AA38UNZ5_9AGAR|nr:hypothetical protein F5890DRAFT_1537703 [Lentinula detonsa]
MHLNLVYVLLAVLGMTHIATAIPVQVSSVLVFFALALMTLQSSEHSDSASTGSLTERKTILVSFGNLAGPEGTEENEAVTNMIDLLFEEAGEKTKGVIPPVRLAFKNHVKKGMKDNAVIPFTFTGLDICQGECEAQADLFRRISFIQDSKGKTLYKRQSSA